MSLKQLFCCSMTAGLVAGSSVLLFASHSDRVSATERECIGDLVCWAEKHLLTANRKCASALEKEIHTAWRWTSGSRMKFFRYRWDVPEQGIVAYLGDRIEVQDSSGSFQPRAYVCDFNPITGGIETIGLLDNRPW